MAELPCSSPSLLVMLYASAPVVLAAFLAARLINFGLKLLAARALCHSLGTCILQSLFRAGMLGSKAKRQKEKVRAPCRLRLPRCYRD